MKEEIQGKLDIQFDAKKEASTQEPVVCLGIEFENDEARRAYFREELRKKLPELKQIEGYPIGEDDDIINLSDPPYYTACPNPWLNDFIAEWEKEKEQLEREGKRSENFEVTEPYASDVSEGKNNPIYNAHSYHTKVPHPAIMRYILHYTQPGDIVLDGFAGTGMTGVAAQCCGNPDVETKKKIEDEVCNAGYDIPCWGNRHSLLSDLSPLASFIAHNYNSPLNAKDFEQKAKQVLCQVKNEYGWMYETNYSNNKGEIKKGEVQFTLWSDVFICPDCGSEIVFWDVAVDIEAGVLKNNLTCPHCGAIHEKKDLNRCFDTIFDKMLNKPIQQPKMHPVLIYFKDNLGKKREKKPDAEDFAVIDRINKMELPYWVPIDKMTGGSEAHRNDKDGICYVYQFFTKRNLIILSSCWDKSSDNSLKFLFTSMMKKSSILCAPLMSNYFAEKKGKSRGGWVGKERALTLYSASIMSEVSIFSQIETRMNSVMVDIGDYNNYIIQTSSSTCLTIKDNSVDYIFIDPPFGSNIIYSDLNLIQEGWLRVKTNSLTEAIEDLSQGKSLFDYGKLMQECLDEFYRVLKDGRWMTVEFSNTSASVWNSIQNALNKAGFIIANVAALDKKQGSIMAYTTPTAVKQDLIITCYKPSNSFLERFISQDCNANTWDFVHEQLEHLPIPTVQNNKATAIIERSPKVLYDRLITFFLMHNNPVPIDATDFQIGLRERYLERDGMFFTADQAAEYEQKRKAAPNGVLTLGIIVGSEADGIQWLKNQLQTGSKTYQELQPEWMQAIAGVRKGDILPELRDLLEQNFIKEADGHWRLPNANDERDLEILRTKTLLREFNLYVEQAAKPKAKLKEVRVEALRAGFKQCYIDKDFATIVMVGDKIPENLLTEDEVLLQYYDIASSRV